MKKLLSVLLAVLMMFVCAVPAFAADGDDDESSTVRRIPAGTKVVTSSTLDDGIIDRLKVKTIYVPSSVTTIKEGALSGYANVTNVYVDNSSDNITIEKGAFAEGANIVYSEKPTPPPATTTTTTKKAEETTTKADDEDKTTEKDDSDDKSTTKKTTAKTTKQADKTTKKTTKKTTSSPATTSDPKKRTTVQHRTLTIKSTKAQKTKKAQGPLIPEVEVDPDTIEEQPDPEMAEEVTTVTFAGEAITDKDGTIIGFEDPKPDRTAQSGDNDVARIATLAGVGAVGLSAIAFLFLKLRRRP